MRKKPRLSSAVALAAAAITGTALFWTSHHVETAERALRHMQQAASSEKQTIRVLSAEWDYLNRPDRLEKLATKYLHMQPPQVRQIASDPDDLPASETPAPPSRKPPVQGQPAALTSSPDSAPSAATSLPKEGRKP
jgi:cell division protein FtsL